MASAKLDVTALKFCHDIILQADTEIEASRCMGPQWDPTCKRFGAILWATALMVSLQPKLMRDRLEGIGAEERKALGNMPIVCAYT